MTCIGIDTGTHTGVAVWDTQLQKFTSIETKPLHRALYVVWFLARRHNVRVFFEDARQRTWFGNNDPKKDRAKLQGAGSVKRDCNIWEDFLKDNGIPYVAVAPKHNCTKLTAEQFKRITGWEGQTSEHARDAAMLVFGRR